MKSLAAVFTLVVAFGFCSGARAAEPSLASGSNPSESIRSFYRWYVTELVGWEHSMKNELIIASYKDLPRNRPGERLQEVLQTLGLEEMQSRFFTSP